jgi:hypothetical protein
MFKKEEAAASSMALEGPLGDDGPPGVVETSTAIGGNSNWSSQDSGSLGTTFSMSLASVSAAASEPEPSDEGMVDSDLGKCIRSSESTQRRRAAKSARQKAKKAVK